MRTPWKRGADDAAPTHARGSRTQPSHARDPEDAPAHVRHEGSAHSEDDPRPHRPRRPHAHPNDRSGWAIPLAAAAIAAVCIIAIAVPAALVSGGSAPDAELSAEVREATVVDEPAPTPNDDEVAIARDALAYGTDLAIRADALGRASTALDQAVRAIQAEGFTVGYYVATPDGQEVLSYNADTPIYGASSIKGPFVLRAFPEGVPGEYRDLVESTLQWSDNDAYYQLRVYLGYDILADQLDQLGITGFTPYMSYAYMTPRQLAALWAMNLAPLSLQGEPGDWLRQTFTKTSNSALGALPESGPVPVTTAYTKAGWIDASEFHCTVDSGLITFGDPTGTGAPGPTYIVAVMTDKSEDFEALGGVVNALASFLYDRAALG